MGGNGVAAVPMGGSFPTGLAGVGISRADVAAPCSGTGNCGTSGGGGVCSALLPSSRSVAGGAAAGGADGATWSEPSEYALQMHTMTVRTVHAVGNAMSTTSNGAPRASDMFRRRGGSRGEESPRLPTELKQMQRSVNEKKFCLERSLSRDV